MPNVSQITPGSLPAEAGEVLHQVEIGPCEIRLHSSGLVYLIDVPGVDELWTPAHQNRADMWIRSVAPGLDRWYSMSICRKLPQMSFEALNESPQLAPETERGCLTLVVANRFGAVLANWLVGFIRWAGKARVHIASTEAEAWDLLSEMMKADGFEWDPDAC